MINLYNCVLLQTWIGQLDAEQAAVLTADEQAAVQHASELYEHEQQLYALQQQQQQLKQQANEVDFYKCCWNWAYNYKISVV